MMKKMNEDVIEEQQDWNDDALGEARVALAESKLTVGVGRTSIHAPVPETPG